MKQQILNCCIISISSIIPLAMYHGMDIVSYTYTKVNLLYFWTFILGILLFLSYRDRRYNLKVYDAFIFIYFILILISTAFSKYISISIYGRENRYEGFITLTCYILLYFMIKEHYQFYLINLKVIILSSVLISIYGIAQFLGFDLFNTLIPYYRGFEAISTIGNCNFLATFTTIVLPINIFAFIYTKRYHYLISSNIIFLCMLCTLTRSAWVSFVFWFCLLILLCLYYKLNKKILSLLVISLFLNAFILNTLEDNLILERFLSINSNAVAVISRNNDMESAGSERYFIWSRAIKLLKEHPVLGSGPDTFEEAFMPKYTKDILNKFHFLYIFDKAHNEFLQIAVTTGIPSLLCYLVFLFLASIKSIKGLKNNRLVIPVFCSLAGYIVQSFFNISVVDVAPIYWMLLGLILNFSQNSEVAILQQHLPGQALKYVK